MTDQEKEENEEKGTSSHDPYLEDLEEMFTIIVLLAQTHGKTTDFDPDTFIGSLRTLLKLCHWNVPIVTG